MQIIAAPFHLKGETHMRKLYSLILLVSLAATSNMAIAADAVEVVAAAAAPANAVKVEVAKMKYVPANLEVEEGSVVVWTNHDALPHNVQIGDPFDIVGDMLRAGQSMAIKFNTAGDYSYICTPHPFMKGKITVKPKA